MLNSSVIDSTNSAESGPTDFKNGATVIIDRNTREKSAREAVAAALVSVTPSEANPFANVTGSRISSSSILRTDYSEIPRNANATIAPESLTVSPVVATEISPAARTISQTYNDNFANNSADARIINSTADAMREIGLQASTFSRNVDPENYAADAEPSRKPIAEIAPSPVARMEFSPYEKQLNSLAFLLAVEIVRAREGAEVEL